MERFAKYEGLGNDFVVLDAREWPASAVTPDLARRLCDRHTGIGGDGVLWVDPGTGRMVIYNADGSRPEMCGNGVRCVAAWLADQGLLDVGGTVVVHSDAGPRPATVLARDPTGRNGARVAVDMGVAVVGKTVDARPAEGDPVAVDVVDLGNPHGVVFAPCRDPEAVVRAVAALAEFPRGVNVELVSPAGTGFRVRVHERGVGWTQACGTGACAVAAAAVARGLAAAGAPVAVTLDGGDLEVVIAPDTGRVRMTGPARRVFEGTVSGVGRA